MLRFSNGSGVEQFLLTLDGNTKWDGFCKVSWMSTVAQQINMSVCRLGVADGVSPRMNTIASRDQFKPIRIGENLVVNYNRH